jgi:hypothetical protein
MNDIIIADEIVMNKIYYVRKQKIMLDRDLALLYGVQPTRLREQVKRNRERFPANFMFQLTAGCSNDFPSVHRRLLIFKCSRLICSQKPEEL